MVYNRNFTGFGTRLAFCTFPGLPDFHELNFPGVGIINPANYTCTDGPIAFRGIDYFAHTVWCAEQASPEVPAIYTDFQPFAQGARQVVTHRFGLAGPFENGVAGENALSGNSDRGIYCAMSNDGHVGNEQGYALLLRHPDAGAYLVQITGGLQNYLVLTYKPNAWQLDAFTRVTLTCVADPLVLKGVYLKAVIQNNAGTTVLAECVYAGSFSGVPTYLPTGTTLAGPGALAYQSLVSYHEA